MGIICGKRKRAHAGAARDREDDGSSLDFPQERFQADVEMDATLSYEDGQFQESERSADLRFLRSAVLTAQIERM